jgi:hypothetical protein
MRATLAELRFKSVPGRLSAAERDRLRVAFDAELVRLYAVEDQL